MKKLFLFAALAAILCSAKAEESDETYVPNRFGDNWEISVAAGMSYESCDRNWARDKTNLGYGGDISGTKWINPNFGARLGAVVEYGHLNLDRRLPMKHLLTINPHFDFMWNLSNQLFGYQADRVYEAVPYIHAGAYACNKFDYDLSPAVGLGLLNRFRINESLMVNLDLRCMESSAEALGRTNAISLSKTYGAYIGVSYKFKQRNWTKASRKNLLRVNEISHENEAYRQEIEQMESELAAAKRDHADAEARAKAAEQAAESMAMSTGKANETTALTNTQLVRLSNPEPLKVFFGIGKSELSIAEQQHLKTYLQIINMVDDKNAMKVAVTGRADSVTGRRKVNEKLAAARAQAIKECLIQNGIRESNITITTELVNSGVADIDRCSEIKFE